MYCYCGSLDVLIAGVVVVGIIGAIVFVLSGRVEKGKNIIRKTQTPRVGLMIFFPPAEGPFLRTHVLIVVPLRIIAGLRTLGFWHLCAPQMGCV